MDPRQNKVIEAIRALDLHATASEVSVKTGLALRESTWFLNKIASDTKGVLEVAGDGTIRYKFSPTFQAFYLLSGVRALFANIGKTVFSVLYYLVRISFGIMLVLSLFAVVALIVLVIVAALTGLKLVASGDSGGGDIDVPVDFSWLEWIDLRFIVDLFYWDFYSTSYSQPAPTSVSQIRKNNKQIRNGRNSYGDSDYQTSATEQANAWMQETYEKESKGNFLLNCFSFLFGEGNPNRGIEDYRWETIATTIKHHSGVVTAEDIAPYLYAESDIENAMLAVMVRFNGQPEVSDNGNIIYVFPELATVDRQASNTVPHYLEERQWDFSSVPLSSMLVVVSLSLVNFVGSYWLFKHLASFHGVLRPYTALIDILLAYSAFFLFFPILRYIALMIFNVFISARNQVRERLRAKLWDPDETLTRKLQDAHEIRLGITQPKVAQEIVYTTDKDLLEQQFD